MLAIGEAGLADASEIGAIALLDAPDGTDARGADLAQRLAGLVDAARRRLSGLTQRLVTGAVVVVPRGGGPLSGAVLLQAVEAAGLDVLRLIEPEAGAGLEETVLEAASLAEDMR